VAKGIARGLATSLRLIRSHPVLARFARHEPEGALGALNAGDGAILRMGTAFVASRLEEAKSRGDVASSMNVTHAAELLVRLGFSFLLMPESSLSLDDPEAAAREVEDLIAPILGEPA
jgi:hypothetical protein